MTTALTVGAVLLALCIGYMIGYRRGRGASGSVIINGERVGDLRGVTMTIDTEPNPPADGSWKRFQPGLVEARGTITTFTPDAAEEKNE